MLEFLKRDLLLKNENLQFQVAQLEAERASIAAPMFTVNKDLMINYVNDAALFAMGYTREEVVNKMTCADFSQTPICGTEKCTLKQCFKTLDPVTGETTVQTKDGRVFPIRAACSPLLDENGNVYGGMEVIVDQTAIVDANGKPKTSSPP